MTTPIKLLNKLIKDFYSDLDKARILDGKKFKILNKLSQQKGKWVNIEDYRKLLIKSQLPFIESIEFKIGKFILNLDRIRYIIEKSNLRDNINHFNVLERQINCIFPYIKQIHIITENQIHSKSLIDLKSYIDQEDLIIIKITNILKENIAISDEFMNLKKSSGFVWLFKKIKLNNSKSLSILFFSILFNLMLILHNNTTNVSYSQNEDLKTNNKIRISSIINNNDNNKDDNFKFYPKVNILGNLKLNKQTIKSESKKSTLQPKRFNQDINSLNNNYYKEKIIQNNNIDYNTIDISNITLTYDEDIIARTIYDEARGESDKGRKLVASVIYNRGNGNPENMRKACLAKSQFSGWNNRELPRGTGKSWEHSVRLALKMCRNNINPDDNGFYFFYNPKKVNKKPDFAYEWKKQLIPGKPGAWKWVITEKLRPDYKKVDNHVFLRNTYGIRFV
jgi:spore germination cell wall hydrolase CwlJ-like protein